MADSANGLYLSTNIGANLSGRALPAQGLQTYDYDQYRRTMSKPCFTTRR
jgi:hypothetical protein